MHSKCKLRYTLLERSSPLHWFEVMRERMPYFKLLCHVLFLYFLVKLWFSVSKRAAFDATKQEGTIAKLPRAGSKFGEREGPSRCSCSLKHHLHISQGRPLHFKWYSFLVLRWSLWFKNYESVSCGLDEQFLYVQRQADYCKVYLLQLGLSYIRDISTTECSRDIKTVLQTP